MIMDYNNRLHILPGSKKKNLFRNKYVLATWVKNFRFQKTDFRTLSYQKTDTKGTLGLLYTNIAQLMTHTTVVYVAAYLAIMLPSLLAYCRG